MRERAAGRNRRPEAPSGADAAVVWVDSLCAAGYFFGNIPMVRENLGLVIVLILLVSIMLGIFAWIRNRRSRSRS